MATVVHWCFSKPLAGSSGLGRASASWRTLLAVGALGMNLAGCQAFKSVSRCNQVLGYINEEFEQASLLHSQSPTSESYRKLSELFAHLESELVARAGTDGELERATKGYAKQMRKVSRETRNYAQALERLEKATTGSDAELEKKAREDLAQIRGRAERLVESVKNEGRKLRETCHPKS